MKISQEEIDAALGVIDSAYAKAGSINEPTVGTIIAAIKAALTVRRARKQAKRERQRKEKDKLIESLPLGLHPLPDGGAVLKMLWTPPTGLHDHLRGKEKDNQVQESVNINNGLQRGEFGELNKLTAEMLNPSKAPEWDGQADNWKFRVQEEGGKISVVPEWDGTFGVGEWEMRNGRFGKVTNLQCGIAGCYLEGEAESMKWNWELDGRSGSNDDPRDLIRPWPKDNPSDSTGASG